ncbi:MAG: HAD-IB family phosphatase [Patescibacteria group bacterium]
MVRPTPERIAELKAELTNPVASFFDFDGTFSERQLLVELMLVVGDLFPKRNAIIQPLRDVISEYENRRTYSYAPVIATAVELAPEFYDGLSVADALTAARSVLERFGEMTYIFPRRFVERMRIEPRRGRGLLIAITGAPQVVAEIFGERYGFDLVYSIVNFEKDGVYTGIRDNRTARDKGGVLEEVTAAFGLDLSESIALGDSTSDIPMLARVGYPFAVNPQAELVDWLRSNPRAVWVNDRQKSGVSFFRSKVNDMSRELFLEEQLANCLPSYVPPFDLPGSRP